MNRMETVLLLVGRLNYTWTNTESLLIYLMAYLMRTNKESAIVVFLSLNTTRARLDLVDRLAKMTMTEDSAREEALKISARMKAEAKLRNKYNHCIYSFDERGSIASTQLMRIAETGDQLKYGKIDHLDDGEMQNILLCIENITKVNLQLWEFMRMHRIEA